MHCHGCTLLGNFDFCPRASGSRPGQVYSFAMVSCRLLILAHSICDLRPLQRTNPTDHGLTSPQRPAAASDAGHGMFACAFTAVLPVPTWSLRFNNQTHPEGHFVCFYRYTPRKHCDGLDVCFVLELVAGGSCRYNCQHSRRLFHFQNQPADSSSSSAYSTML